MKRKTCLNGVDKELKHFINSGEDTYFAGKLDELSFYIFTTPSIAVLEYFLKTECFEPKRIDDHFVVSTICNEHFSVDFWIFKNDIKMFYRGCFVELPDIMLSKKVRKALAKVTFDYLSGVKMDENYFDKNMPYGMIIIQ